MSRPILVLLNARARGGLAARLEAEIATAFQQTGQPVEIRRARRELTTIAQQAINDGHTTLVAAGGDGTIRTVAAIAAAHHVTLGVIPIGTFNHFAKDAGLPLTIPEAVQVITAGHQRSVNYATVNDQFFLSSASLGLHALFVRHRQAHEHYLGKWLAIPVALVQTFSRFNAWRFTLTLPGRRHTLTTPVIFIGNNDYQAEQLGLSPSRTHDREGLFIYTLECDTRWQLLQIILRRFLGRLNNEQYFRSWTASHCQVNSRRDTMSITLDGELMRLASPLEFTTHPQGLRIFAPHK